MGFLLSILSFFGSDTFKKLLPYILGALFVIALFGTGYYLGYSKAHSACKEQQYISELQGEKDKNTNLQKQYDNSQKVIADLTKQNHDLQIIKDGTIKYIYKTVPAKKECDIGPDVIEQINKVRAGK